MIHPSDHFLYPEHRFLETIRQSIDSVEAMPGCLRRLGVQPNRLETEYGWIQRGRPLNNSSTHPVHAVSWFLEKPGAAQADAALRAGSLWNTWSSRPQWNRCGKPPTFPLHCLDRPFTPLPVPLTVGEVPASA
ncbi:MAG: hypothetical protein ABI988_01955 [Nitrospirota bacterium]